MKKKNYEQFYKFDLFVYQTSDLELVNESYFTEDENGNVFLHCIVDGVETIDEYNPIQDSKIDLTTDF